MSLFIRCLVICSLCLGFTAFADPLDDVKHVVVFGDSYSDNGNAFRASKGHFPNIKRYFRGRFTDGPVWVEYFTQLLHLNPNNPKQLQDFAVGAARANGDYPIKLQLNGDKSVSFTVPDIQQQFKNYVASKAVSPKDSVYILYIGTNDFFAEPDIPMGNHQAFIEKIVAAQRQLIVQLNKLGAKQILVVNMRNLAQLPITDVVAGVYHQQHPKTSVAQFKEKLAALVQTYNQQLNDQLEHLPNVYVVDVNDFERRMLLEIKAAGVQYHYQDKRLKFTKTQACYINNGDYQHALDRLCTDPSRYYFYDQAHPSTYASRLFAMWVTHEVKNK